MPISCAIRATPWWCTWKLATVLRATSKVLDARALYPNSTLADLYDPAATPAELVKAHNVLDKAVDVAYGRREFKSEAERVAFLFELYEKLTSLFTAPKKKARK